MHEPFNPTGVISLALVTSMRRGELPGLHWET